MNSHGVTGLVLTYNGERVLEQTLASLAFCDELLVVDSGSTDATLAIAEAAGARIVSRAWEGPGPQFAFAFEHIRTPWVVSLDHDEYCTPQLQQQIQAALAAPGDKAGWYCPRRSYYFDRFLGHCGWYPDYLLRVFRLEQMQLKIALPHYSFHPLGPTGTLAGDIVHYPYNGLTEHVAKINAYTQSAAEDKYARGERAGLATALGHALARFVKIYLLKRGFLDGRAGLVLALNSFFYVFHKYIRMAELEATAKQGHGAGASHSRVSGDEKDLKNGF
ncbi:MAG: glycosyltransferase family 2 protein [Thermodesulfobacteriota bacterium]